MKISEIVRPNFYKKNSIEIEGFISETEFNGILFLLKEPNDPSVKEFWFKKVVNDMDCTYYNTLEEGKSTATRFKNNFEKCLKQIENTVKYNLNDSAYMNLRPDGGESTESIKYEKLLKELSNQHERWKIIESLSPKIIFTCKKNYEKLKTIMNCENKDIDSGIKYKNKALRYFESKINGKDCAVYEIYHPSCRRVGYPL